MLMLAANETARIQNYCTICKFHSFPLVLDNCIFTLTNLDGTRRILREKADSKQSSLQLFKRGITLCAK